MDQSVRRLLDMDNPIGKILATEQRKAEAQEALPFRHVEAIEALTRSIEALTLALSKQSIIGH